MAERETKNEGKEATALDIDLRRLGLRSGRKLYFWWLHNRDVLADVLRRRGWKVDVYDKWCVQCSNNVVDSPMVRGVAIYHKYYVIRLVRKKR